MGKELRVLIVEDSKPDAQLLLEELRQGGYELVSQQVDTAGAMNEALDGQGWDVVLADYMMPRFDGSAALELLNAKGSDIPVIIVSGQIGEDIAVQAMKSGAHDYIMKGNLARLVPAVERELRESEVRRERRKAEQERDLLVQRLREINEQLVLTSLRAQEQADEVQRHAAELDAVISAIAEALVIYGPKGEIIKMNTAARELLGYSAAESDKPLLERMLLLSIEAEDGKPFPLEETPVTRALRGEEAVRGVVMTVHRASDGNPVKISASAAPIRTADGTPRGVVAVFTNITGFVKPGPPGEA